MTAENTVEVRKSLMWWVLSILQGQSQPFYQDRHCKASVKVLNVNLRQLLTMLSF